MTHISVYTSVCLFVCMYVCMRDPTVVLVCNVSMQAVKRNRVQSPSVFTVVAIKIQNQDESEVFGFYLNLQHC